MKCSRMLLTLACASGLILTAPISAQAGKVYKWVDEQGITHYTERRPTESGEVEELGVRSTSSSATAAEANTSVQSGAASAAPAAADDDAGGIPIEMDASEENLNKAVRAHNCQKAKKMLAVLNNSARVREKNDKGELVYLDEKQMAERKAMLQKRVQDDCS